MKKGDKYLCKKVHRIYHNYMLVDNMVIGEWYYITWISDNMVQFGTKDGEVLRLLGRKKICYGYESMWDYFYTKREVRKQKLDKLLNCK